MKTKSSKSRRVFGSVRIGCQSQDLPHKFENHETMTVERQERFNIFQTVSLQTFREGHFDSKHVLSGQQHWNGERERDAELDKRTRLVLLWCVHSGDEPLKGTR